MKALRILAVDDSPSFLTILSEILKGDGHSVILAHSGEEAIERYLTEKPDLIIMDRIMPGIGGIQAVREIRKLPAPIWIPIILITSTMDEGDVLEAFSAGVDEFLLKPINALHLHIRLNSVMRIAAIQRSTQAVIDELLDGVIRIDASGLISMFNAAAERIFSYTAAEVLGKNVSMLMPSPDREQHDAYIGNYHASGDGKIIGKGRRVLGQRKDGSAFPMHLGITEANTPDGRYFIGLVRDLSIQEQLLEQIHQLASSDPLTELPNRRQCTDHLSARYLAAGAPHPCTLFYCDLDGFKAVNDQFGHATGDTVLTEAARRIRSVVFVRDFVGRLGGDEFVIVIDGVVSDTEAHALGERVIQALSPDVPTQQGAMHIGVSIGYAHSRDHLSSAQTLLHAADQAMYAAKRAGKGRIVQSTPTSIAECNSLAG